MLPLASYSTDICRLPLYFLNGLWLVLWEGLDVKGNVLILITLVVLEHSLLPGWLLAIANSSLQPEDALTMPLLHMLTLAGCSSGATCRETGGCAVSSEVAHRRPTSVSVDETQKLVSKGNTG